jgi:cell division protein FtsL
MSENTLVYSNKNLVTADGVVNISYHTSQVYVYNKGVADVDIKLNGQYTVLIPAESTEYIAIDGDYTTIEVVTAASAVAVYALG